MKLYPAYRAMACNHNPRPGARDEGILNNSANPSSVEPGTTPNIRKLVYIQTII